MDVQMPGVNGFQATSAIREREKRSGGHIPIIALTAHSMEGDRERCLAAGMDDYIPKPIRIDQLLSVMKRWINMPTQQHTKTSKIDTGAFREIDKAMLIKNTDGDMELLREIIKVFLDSFPKRLSEIGDAIAQGDGETLCRCAHSLKGSVGNFSKGRSFEAAKKLERLGWEKDLASAPEALAELETALGRLQRDLEALLSEGVTQQT
jgi:CheY-like chemotaxis protein